MSERSIATDPGVEICRWRALRSRFDEFLWDPNAIYWRIGYYSGVRILLPVFGKPEVVMADLPEGYDMVYEVLASTSRALWARNDDRQAFPAIPDVEIWRKWQK